MHENFRRDSGREGQDGVGVEFQLPLNDGSAPFEFLSGTRLLIYGDGLH
jgi:hypothetical protein